MPCICNAGFGPRLLIRDLMMGDNTIKPSPAPEIEIPVASPTRFLNQWVGTRKCHNYSPQKRRKPETRLVAQITTDRTARTYRHKARDSNRNHLVRYRNGPPEISPVQIRIDI
ncbi:hypothetical protein AYI68_g4703 [Smittium mucronatum]|uniref:Uncharacterized protein n=1 Tax=Smittium mucronatum TaxID=133383 RepID=A0A1R0GWC0_9FUNG|nr:hypothetical protein AYI68_g4703 [Smittium mucronatum]